MIIMKATIIGGSRSIITSLFVLMLFVAETETTNDPTLWPSSSTVDPTQSLYPTLTGLPTTTPTSSPPTSSHPTTAEPTKTPSPTSTNVPTGTSAPTTTLVPTVSSGHDIHCGAPNVTDCAKLILWLNDQILTEVEERRRRRRSRLRRLQSSSSGDEVEKKYVIDVYFFGMKQEEPSKVGQLTSHQVQKFMQYLHHGFRKTPFAFNKAGAARQVSNNDYHVGGVFGRYFKPLHREPGKDVLNIWVADIRRLNHIGFATFPEKIYMQPLLDGVVIQNPDADLRGSTTSLDIYNTLIHEVGHWLGLLHTFSGGCDGKDETLGDGIDDTPAHKGPSWDQNGADTCFNDGNDPPKTCGSKDPINNYMNYIVDVCMEDYGEFTEDQIKRMEHLFVLYRRPPSEGGRRLLEQAENEFGVNSSTFVADEDLLKTCRESVTDICKCDLDCAADVVGVLQLFPEMQRQVFLQVTSYFQARCRCASDDSKILLNQQVTEEGKLALEFLVTETIRLVPDDNQYDDRQLLLKSLARHCLPECNCDLSCIWAVLHGMIGPAETASESGSSGMWGIAWSILRDDYSKQCALHNDAIEEPLLLDFAGKAVAGQCRCQDVFVNSDSSPTAAQESLHSLQECIENVLEHHVRVVAEHFGYAKDVRILFQHALNKFIQPCLADCDCDISCMAKLAPLVGDSASNFIKHAASNDNRTAVYGTLKGLCFGCQNSTVCHDEDEKENNVCLPEVGRIGYHCLPKQGLGEGCSFDLGCESGYCHFTDAASNATTSTAEDSLRVGACRECRNIYDCPGIDESNQTIRFCDTSHECQDKLELGAICDHDNQCLRDGRPVYCIEGVCSQCGPHHNNERCDSDHEYCSWPLKHCFAKKPLGSTCYHASHCAGDENTCANQTCVPK